MDLLECIQEPAFRREFVSKEKEGLDSVVDGNGNMMYHNDAKISILEEIKAKTTLSEEEVDVIDEHIGALKSLNTDLVNQNERLKVMVGIYEKFNRTSQNSHLKLT